MSSLSEKHLPVLLFSYYSSLYSCLWALDSVRKRTVAVVVVVMG